MENEKPKWLKRLENESWQAELVVSGAAIFGSLQLPKLMSEVIEGCLVFFPAFIHFGLYVLFIYLFLAINILIVSLIVHFVVRALWIGLIGLNSVFPAGINPESKSYPRHFMDQLINEYPQSLKHITELDKFCSVIFAFCSFLILTFLAITIDVVIVLLLFLLLSNVLPEEVGVGIFTTLLILLTVAGLTVYILNHKKLKESTFAKKFQYPIYKWMGIITLHIFRKPITRLSFTFISNLELKKYFAWLGGITLICMVLFFFQVLDSKLIYLTNSDFFYSTFERSDRIMHENYENTRRKDSGRILSAVLESDRITGSSMKVFIPVFSNEEDKMDALCGTYVDTENEEKKIRKEKERAFHLDCLNKYHAFYLNDSLVTADIIRYTHPNKGENGIQASLKTNILKEGLNVLRIEKMQDEQTVFRTMAIPFWFEKGPE